MGTSFYTGLGTSIFLPLGKKIAKAIFATLSGAKMINTIFSPKGEKGNFATLKQSKKL
jgi:hypothetical protein